MKLRFAGLCVLVLTLSASSQPVPTLDNGTFIATGLTPGKGAFVIAVAHEASGYGQRISDVARLLPADNLGRVRLELNRPVPANSVWVVIDSDSGRSSIASPHPGRVEYIRERPTMGEVRRLEREHDYLYFVLVRPGVGAWTLEVEDGGYYDSDMDSNRRILFDVERMSAIGDSPSAPRMFTRSDVVFAIDPVALSVVEIRAE